MGNFYRLRQFLGVRYPGPAWPCGAGLGTLGKLESKVSTWETISVLFLKNFLTLLPYILNDLRNDIKVTSTETLLRTSFVVLHYVLSCYYITVLFQSGLLTCHLRGL